MANVINFRGKQNTDPIRNFRFLVDFIKIVETDASWKPSSTLGFTSVSGLAVSTESIPYREGGYNTTVHQVPGQSTFSPVTFQRGVTIGSRQHWDWMRMLFQTVNGTKFTQSDSFRADVEISVLNHPVPYAGGTLEYGSVPPASEDTQAGDDVVVAKFRLYNAWPTTVAYSDLNAGDNALMVEQMTLVHEGMHMLWAKESLDGTLT